MRVRVYVCMKMRVQAARGGGGWCRAALPPLSLHASPEHRPVGRSTAPVRQNLARGGADKSIAFTSSAPVTSRAALNGKGFMGTPRRNYSISLVFSSDKDHWEIEFLIS